MVFTFHALLKLLTKRASTQTTGAVNWRFSLGLTTNWWEKSVWWKHTSLPSSPDSPANPCASTIQGWSTPWHCSSWSWLALPSSGTRSPRRQKSPSRLGTTGRRRCLCPGHDDSLASEHESAVASWGTAFCMDAWGHVPCCWFCCRAVAASKGWKRD